MDSGERVTACRLNKVQLAELRALLKHNEILSRSQFRINSTTAAPLQEMK